MPNDRRRPILLVCAGMAMAACAAGGGRVGVASDAVPDTAHPREFRVAVISDMNGPYGSTAYGEEVGRAVALIRDEWQPDLVLAAGDLIAGQRPTLPDATVRAMWAAFDSAVAAPLRTAGIPFGFTLGNHDASAYPAHGRDRAFAIEHWRAPEHHPGVSFVDSVHFPLYYSFRQGPLFIIAWDATWEGTLSSTAMIDWLRAQLDSRVARDAPFRVVLGHLPLYAVAEGRNLPGEVLAEADSLRSILEGHDVHTYISGHHHAYYPGRRGALELLHAGALGDGPRPLIGHVTPSPRTVTIMEFVASRGVVEYITFTLDGEAAPRIVDTAALPPRIDSERGYVVRRDLMDH